MLLSRSKKTRKKSSAAGCLFNMMRALAFGRILSAAVFIFSGCVAFNESPLDSNTGDGLLLAVSLLGGSDPPGSSLPTIVAVGNACEVYRSRDGDNWAMSTMPGCTAGSLKGIVYTGSQFVVVGDAGGSTCGIWTSPDGLSWQTRSCGGTKPLSSIAYDPASSTLVAVGQCNTTNYSVESSTNGASSWINSATYGAAACGTSYAGSVARTHTSGHFIFTDTTTGTGLSTNGGATWAPTTAAVTGYANGITAVTADSPVVAVMGLVGAFANATASSNEGVSWSANTAVPASGGAMRVAIPYAAQSYLVIGDICLMAKTTNNFTSYAASPSTMPGCTAFGNSIIYAGIYHPSLGFVVGGNKVTGNTLWFAKSADSSVWNFVGQSGVNNINGMAVKP